MQDRISTWLLVVYEIWILKSTLNVILDVGVSQRDFCLPMMGDPIGKLILLAN